MSQKRPAVGGKSCWQAFVGTHGQNEKTYNVRADYRFNHNINTQLLSLPLFFLGIPCPFCGMTRAFLCVLKGDLIEAFYFHPLWPLVIVAGIIFILVKIKVLKLSGKAVNILAFIAAFLFLLCFILRHVYHSPIVQIDLSKGILF